MKILITGVHSTPAFAVIDELLSRKDYEIYYVGQKHSFIFDKNLSAEYKVAQTKNIKFINFFAGKISRNLSLSSLIWWARLPIGYLQAFFLLKSVKPEIIVTFGSHVGVPIATIGHLLKIPIIAHEQTITIGKATKVIQKYANVVCLSWKKQLEDHNDSKYIFTGNPVRSEIFKTGGEPVFRDNEKKTILFMGGNQGAHAINEAVLSVIKELTNKYNVIIQTGKNTIVKDYEKFVETSSKINVLGIKLIVKDYIFPLEVGSYYNKADLMVCRSGANSVYEIAILGKPALFIPLPNSSQNEAFLNAKMMEDAGTASILEQKNLSGESLLEKIDDMILNLDKYKANVSNAQTLVKKDASREIADIIESNLAKH